MKSTVENLSPTRVRLAVEVPFDDLRPSLAAAYKAIGQQVRVPGFRPGKVPARIIDQRVGRGAVLQEAVNEALPKLYSAAVGEHELRVLGQPDIEIDRIDDNESLAFTAEVDIRPQIELPDVSALEVSVDDVEVKADDVEEQLTSLRERFGTLKGVERPAEDGDYISLDLRTVVDGEELESGAASGLSYVVGSDDLVDGLDDAIRGQAAGASATFTTTLRNGEQAGSEAEVTATVNTVKAKELPELDDDFATLASEFDTIEELRSDLETRLRRVKMMEQGAQAREKLLEQLLETVEFPLPDSAVQGEVDYREHEIVHQLGHDDAVFDQFLSLQGKTREEFKEELRADAEKSVRAQFILDAIAEQTEVQVGEGELTEYLVRQAQRYQMPPQEFANQIMQAGNLPLLYADVRRNKALAQVLESAVITDASGNQVDLKALNPEALDEIVAGDADEVHDHDHHDHDHHHHHDHDHDHDHDH